MGGIFFVTIPNWETVAFIQESEDGEERPYWKSIWWVGLAGSVAWVTDYVVVTLFMR